MKPQLFNFNQKPVRFVMINNHKYAVGKDSAEAIGYINGSKAVREHVKDKYKTRGLIQTPSGEREVTLISEPGLYQLAAQSKLPDAEPFQDWLFEEVLPQINENGAYVTANTAKEWLENPDTMIEILQRYKDVQDENQKLHDEKKANEPKIGFADSVATSNTSILVGELAKIIKQNGIDMGAKRLFAWMRDNGYLIKRKGSDWNMPTQRSMEAGLFEIKETTINHASGYVTVNKTPKVTGKGQIFFINKIKKEFRKAA